MDHFRAGALCCALSCCALTSCASMVVVDPHPAIADTIVDAPGATGTGFHDPMLAIDGVQGGGAMHQSLDVFSLGLHAGSDDYLVLEFSGRRLTDGPGADLAVFENAFNHPGGVFMDPIVVAVSTDGTTWLELPHDYRAADPHTYSGDPHDWQGFAGLTPVLLNDQRNPVDPFDPIAAGGDELDLAMLGEAPDAMALREEGARFVRLSTAATQIDPNTGAPYPRDAISDGPDIDGVYGRYFVGGQ